MNLLRSSPIPLIAGASLLLGFSGCSTPKAHPLSATLDRAYVEYWAPNEGDGKLRLAVKDLIDMKGVVTSAGSEFLAKHSKPAERDAACLRYARRKDVVIVGKTNTTELAVAVSGINQYYGTPKNPVSRHHNIIPGGSSSGSAVAVANHTADVAFGTDTAGSIRVPAACCGVAGLKTTFGMIPLDGVYPISPTHLDTVGPIARDVPGLVKGMELLQPGFEGKYARAMVAKPTAKSIKVGRLYLDGTDPKVDRALDAALARAGFTVVPLSPEFKKLWVQAEKDAGNVAAASAWLYDQQFRSEPGVTTRTKVIVAVGQHEYQASLPEALARQPAWKANLARVLKQVDVVALPTLQKLPPSVPWLGGTVAFELAVLGLQNTEAVNLAGNPALAVPVPIDDWSVPVASLQLIGRDRHEAELLNAGRFVETTNPVR